MTNFKIGQSIICRDDSGFSPAQPHPVKGRTYTVESFSCCIGCGTPTIVLSEIKGHTTKQECTQCNGTCEYENKIRKSYRASRFAPLQNVSATSEILEKFKLTEERADAEIKELEQI